MTDPSLSPLRRRMIEDMTVRNLSPATQRSYLHAVAKFSRHFGRSPDCLDLEDVRSFQVYLVAQGISWPALNQTVCALRFFYGVTLNRPEIPERIAYAREPRKLPVILSADEVVRFLEAVPSLWTAMVRLFVHVPFSRYVEQPKRSRPRTMYRHLPLSSQPVHLSQGALARFIRRGPPQILVGSSVSVGYTRAMKDVGLRIRVQRDLRDQFIEVCRAQDKPAAQVIREFMRRYIEENRDASRKPGVGTEKGPAR